MSGDDNTTYQNPQKSMKAALRQTFIAVSAYSKESERFLWL